MSMSLYLILALGSGPTTPELNAAAIEYKVPIEYTAETDLSKHSGYLPVKLKGIETGVEIHVIPKSEVPSVLENTDITPESGVVYQFRWGGNFMEGATAFYTAVVLTEKYNGIAFDPESGMKIGIEQLNQGADIFFNMEE